MMGNYQVLFLEGLVAVMQPRLLDEHRLFSYISQNWRARPLVDLQTVIELIGSTTTRAGLTVKTKVDSRKYEKGKKISDDQFAMINIKRSDFHPE